jgi:hypothetical protein
MSQHSKNIAAARWRHFIPKGESFDVILPYVQTERKPDGTITIIEKVKTTYSAPAPVAEGQTSYQLPISAQPAGLESISVSFNGILQPNGNVVLYTTGDGKGNSIFHYGSATFDYDANTNRILFQRTPTGINKAPPAGTAVQVEVVNGAGADSYKRLPMRRFLIQGANPIDDKIIDTEDVPTGFQGGYRCTLKLISTAAHGHVRIYDDKSEFEYKADLGYYGYDSFAYKLVNAMGQESEAYCIRLSIGVDQIQKEGEEDDSI